MDYVCFSTIFLFLSLAVVLLKHANSQSLIFYVDSRCSEHEHYDQGSEYHINLSSLLDNLTSHSDTELFYNHTTGRTSNIVYGLYYCSTSTSNQVRDECVTAAAREIQRRCPSSVQALVWYAGCTLRYANHNIFSINDNSTFLRTSTGPAVYGRFNSDLSNTFYEVLNMATTGCSSMMSGITTTQLEDDILLNFQAECSPDLTRSDCRSCLQTALQRLPAGGSKTGLVYQPNCRLTYLFYDLEDLLGSATNKKLYIALGILTPTEVISLLLVIFLVYRLKRKKGTKKPTGLEEIERMENLHVEFDAIKAATYNFCEANKLGQGGFGAVYMGTLADGQAVAVKRLSNASGQGIREFKAEACLAAKLQHKNLVKVFGFCLEKNEMLLVYEFVPNKSLDRFLFDAKRRALLKWETRYKIIVGIARGLHYLHEDSCPKIIHRDLKPSNILLDGVMDPKIADFGMAKLFAGDQTQGNTSRIGGTFGYMAPEYVATGNFSIKSDIFSYGVILLEIVSGSRNRANSAEQEKNLLSHAWKLWNQGAHLNLVDVALANNFSRSEMERCIQVGLLCTQEDPAKRPNMASVLIMLNTQINVNLPSPASPPAFPYKRDETPSDSHVSYGIPVEEVISELSPR